VSSLTGSTTLSSRRRLQRFGRRGKSRLHHSCSIQKKGHAGNQRGLNKNQISYLLLLIILVLVWVALGAPPFDWPKTGFPDLLLPGMEADR
jgi:hypothetical protein